MCNVESRNSCLPLILYNAIILRKKKKKNPEYEIPSERKVHMDIMADSKMYTDTFSEGCHDKQVFPTYTYWWRQLYKLS